MSARPKRKSAVAAQNILSAIAQDEVTGATSSKRGRDHGETDLPYAHSGKAIPETKVKIGAAREQGVLPLEIRLQIVDILLENNGICAVGNLMKSCRMWYTSVVGSELHFRAKAKDLGAQRRKNHCDWWGTYLDKYLTRCVHCKVNVGKHSIDWLPDESKLAKLCEVCSQNHLYILDNHLAAYGLEQQDMTGVSVFLGSHYRLSDLQATAEAKGGARCALITTLVDSLDFETKKEYEKAKLRVENLSASSLLRHAHEKLFSIFKKAPTVEAIKVIADEAARREGMADALKSELERQAKISLLSKCQNALRWRLHSPDGSSWLDCLSMQTKSISDFINEVQNPRISHSPDRCAGGCSMTPALACPNRKCCRCCPGCSRHPQRSYDRFEGYGYRYHYY